VEAQLFIALNLYQANSMPGGSAGDEMVVVTASEKMTYDNLAALTFAEEATVLIAKCNGQLSFGVAKYHY